MGIVPASVTATRKNGALDTITRGFKRVAAAALAVQGN